MNQDKDPKSFLYNSYNEYFKKKFGQRVQKIPVHAGFTCPNRDGTKGWGGCTFCNNDSFSMHSSNKNLISIKDQISSAISFYKRRFQGLNKFIIYFQSYTNTYKPLDELRALYEDALKFEGVIGLSIGTRPDCLEDDKLNYLEMLAKKYHITLEIGLESFSDNTLKRINRGHNVSDFHEAINRSKNRGILLCTHLILGFPWEDESDFENTLSHLSKLELDFIKFHQLQIIKNTTLGNEYLKNPFPVIDYPTYFRLLGNIVSHLNPKIVIQRLFSDYDESFLLSPSWGKSLSELTQEFKQYLVKNKLKQGKFFTV